MANVRALIAFFERTLGKAKRENANPININANNIQEPPAIVAVAEPLLVEQHPLLEPPLAVAPLAEEHNDSSIMRELFHHDLLTRTMMNETNTPGYQMFLKAAHKILFGYKFTALGLWPAAFAVMTLFNDYAIHMLYPQERYGNTWGQILLGTSTNQNTLTSHFGSDEVDSYATIFAYCLVLAPIPIGLVGSYLVPYANEVDIILNNFDHNAHNEHASQIFWAPASVSAVLALSLYAAVRYLELLSFKFQQLDDYRIQKAKCEHQHEDYLYMQQTQRYECTPCGAWKSIPYRHSRNAQSCVDYLLQTSKDPDEIKSRLDDLTDVRSEIQKFALPAQALTAWSETQLDEVLSAFERIAPNQLSEIKIVLPKDSAVTVTQVKSLRIARFIRENPAKTVILNNFKLNNPSDSEAFFASLHNNTNIEKFVFTGSGMGDAAGNGIASAIPTWPKLKLIDISATGPLRQSASALSDSIAHHPSLSSVITRANPLNDTQMNQMIDGVARGKVVVFDASETYISKGSTERMAQQFTGKNMQELVLRDCQLSDEAVESLLPVTQTLQAFDISGNELEPHTVKLVTEHVANSTITKFGFADCGISDRSASEVANNIFKHSNVIDINLAGNVFKRPGLKIITAAIPDSKLETVIFDGIEYPEIGDDLALLYINSNNITVKNWSLRGMNLAPNSTSNFMTNMRNLIGINIGGENPSLDDSIAPALGHMISANPSLSTIVMDNLNLGGNVTSNLKQALPGSGVKVLDIYKTKILEDIPGATEFIAITLKQPNGDNIGGLVKITRNQINALAASIPNTDLTYVKAGCVKPTIENAIDATEYRSQIQYDLVNNNQGRCQTSSATRAANVFTFLADVRRSLMEIFSQPDLNVEPFNASVPTPMSANSTFITMQALNATHTQPFNVSTDGANVINAGSNSTLIARPVNATRYSAPLPHDRHSGAALAVFTGSVLVMACLLYAASAKPTIRIRRKKLVLNHADRRARQKIKSIQGLGLYQANHLKNHQLRQEKSTTAHSKVVHKHR